MLRQHLQFHVLLAKQKHNHPFLRILLQNLVKVVLQIEVCYYGYSCYHSAK